MDLEEISTCSSSGWKNQTGQNYGIDEQVYVSLQTVIVRTASIVLAVTLIVASNCVNLVILPQVKCFGEVSRFLLRCLAVTDLLIGVCLTFAIWPAIADYWPFGDVLCKVVASCGTLLAMASSLTLMCISVDRFLAVTRPLHYVSDVTLKRACCGIVAVWLVCIAFVAVVNTATWPPFQNITYDTVLCNCKMVFFEGTVFPRALVACAVCVVLPSFIISASNAKLLFVSIHHAKRIDAMPGLNAVGQHRSLLSRELKAIKTTLFITGVFYVAWTPFVAIQIYQAFSPDAPAEWLQFLGGYLVLTNSWWNAFIYSFMNKSFRNKLVELLARKCKCCTKTEHVSNKELEGHVTTTEV